jgi:5-methylcytosine-specific restriction protein A
VTKRIDWQWDEIVMAAALVDEAGWRSIPRQTSDEVKELSQRLRTENPAAAVDPAFRSPNSVHLKLQNIKTAHPAYAGKPTKGGELTKQIADAFANAPIPMRKLAHALRSYPVSATSAELDVRAFPASTTSDVIAATEGRVRHRIARFRERDRNLRMSKIRSYRDAHGNIDCEVCGFSFESTYGELGADYVHVHHVVPLHFSGEVVNGLANLALVCANCHSMIHRHYPWKEPAELRAIVTASKRSGHLG